MNRKAEKEDNLNFIKKYDTSELEPEMQKRVENTNKKFKDILDKEIQRAVEVVLTIPILLKIHESLFLCSKKFKVRN